MQYDLCRDAQFDNKKDSSGKRGFATSACAAAGGKTGHTAESYFKDVDSTPPSSSKTHQVDSSVAGAPVQRANEPQTGDFTKRGPGTKDYETVSFRDTSFLQSGLPMSCLR